MNIRAFFSGLRYALPVILGYLPVGFAFGVIAAKAGFTPPMVWLMSFLVYAGSAQFIAVSMLQSGAGVPGIILVTFVVNLRHLLMSAALIPYLNRWSKTAQAVFALELTDESFAMNLSRFTESGVNQAQTFGLNFFAHMSWAACGFLGALLGESDIDLDALGLNFALPGMFIALIIPWLRQRRGLIGALAAALCSLLLAEFSRGSNLHILAAAIFGATLASLIPQKQKGRP